MQLEEILIRCGLKLGITLTNNDAGIFQAYYDYLSIRAQEMNLTAISNIHDVARLHFLDSLAIAPYISDFARVIDVGSGAGFPGLPLKIVMPKIELTLLDATQKRVEFLGQLCGKIGVNAQCLHARAEEIGHDAMYREMYDAALSRAVARLDMLCELCLPFVKLGGVFIAMKSADCDDEIDQAADVIARLGAVIETRADYVLPKTQDQDELIKRCAVIIRKTDQTPKEYPRRFAVIKRTMR